MAAGAMAANHGLTWAADVAYTAAMGQAADQATLANCALDPPRPDFKKISLATPVVVARYAYQAQRHGGLPIESIPNASGHAAMAVSAFTTAMERFMGAKAAYRSHIRTARLHLGSQLTAMTYNAQVVDLQLRDLRNAILGVKGPLFRLDRQPFNALLKAEPQQFATVIDASWSRALSRSRASNHFSDDVLRQIDSEMQDKIRGVGRARIRPAVVARAALRPISSAFATNAFKELADAALEPVAERRRRINR